MTTSGTVGQTTITVQQLIDHSFRRAGVSPAEQTVDTVISAQENLYFYLQSLSNTGINLWTVEPVIIGTMANQLKYKVGVGTIDIRKLLYRTVDNQCTGGTPYSSAGGNATNAFNGLVTTSCIQTSANGYISYQFPQSQQINNVGIMTYGNQTYTLVWEWSNDGINWQQAYPSPTGQLKPTNTPGPVSFTDYYWQYYDLPTPVNAMYFRVRETAGGILSVRQVCFNIIQLEINIARVNFDVYSTLTNKTFSSENQLQYWFNRKALNPEITMWPVTNTFFDQIVAWRTRQIQDVGSLTNTVEIPDRWIESVVTEVARRILLETPGADLKRYQMLKDEADAATALAQSEERDKSPIQLSPSIRGYTR